MSPAADTPPQRQVPGFLNNVLWNWFGVSINLVSGLLLTPIIVKRLGVDNYGLWVVVTSLVDYYWLLDLGMRSAIVRYSAHYSTTRDFGKFNEVICTSLAYNLVLSPVLLAASWWAMPHVGSLLHQEHPLIPKLFMVVAGAWAITSLLSTFTSTLEGLQRYDIVNQTAFVMTALRAAVTLALLLAGYGVLELAYVTVGGQILLHGVNFFRLRRVMPHLKLSPAFAHLKVLTMMLRYGVHSVMSSLALRLIGYSPPLLIGHFLPLSSVAYYTSPLRLLDYTVEAVARIGNVSNARAAHLWAAGRQQELARFSVTVNRYSLALFLPLILFLIFYGQAFFAWWIDADFARQCAGVLMALLVGQTLGNAAQYSSNSILFGIGRHQMYARGMLVEAVLAVAGLWFLLPLYGITTAAAFCSALMVLNRGLFVPWQLARELKISWLGFLANVNRPLLAGIPVAAVLWPLRQTILPGAGLWQLLLAGAITVLVYAPFAYWTIPAEDREPILYRLRGYLGRIYAIPAK